MCRYAPSLQNKISENQAFKANKQIATTTLYFGSISPLTIFK